MMASSDQAEIRPARVDDLAEVVELIKPFVEKVFSITSMDRIFDIQPDVDTAMKAF